MYVYVARSWTLRLYHLLSTVYRIAYCISMCIRNRPSSLDPLYAILPVYDITISMILVLVHDSVHDHRRRVFPR